MDKKHQLGLKFEPLSLIIVNYFVYFVVLFFYVSVHINSQNCSDHHNHRIFSVGIIVQLII
jgi:hypothetical protein